MRQLAPRGWAWRLMALVGLTVAVPAVAQEDGSPAATGENPVAEAASLARLLSGQSIPVTLPLSRLDSSWKQMRIRSLGEYGSSEQLVYTRGLTVKVAGETYLIVYSPAQHSQPQMSPDRFRRSLFSTSSLLTPDTPLAMTLVRTSDVRTLRDIRPFDPRSLRDPIPGSQLPVHYFWALSKRYLGELHQALSRYRADFGYLPPLTTPTLARRALAPYAVNDVIFTQPGIDEPYLPNPLLSGRNWLHLRRRMRTVVFYEAAPSTDEKRTVLLLNGTVLRVDEKAWRELAARSEIELPGEQK